MSRSTRKPYSAVTGVRSAKKYKQQAARGLRRKQNQWLRTSDCQNEHSLIPHRLECTWNQVYCWGRDGSQRYSVPTRREWSEFRRLEQGLFRDPREENYLKKHASARPNVWPPVWYVELTRK